MKKCLWIILICSCCLAAERSYAQSFEAQQLLLDWEKLTQLKKILSDMYEGYKIIEGGYTAIRDLSHGNFDLHKAFLDGLLAVSPAVRNYYKVAEIISYQLAIVKEYKQAYSAFHSSGAFSPNELLYLSQVYSRLFDQSVQTLNTLINVLTDGSMRASDDERLRQIDFLHKDMLGKLTFLRQFNNQASLLSTQRAVDMDDATFIEKLYGIKH
ncbi:MAG: hypothetical protein BGO55_08810 [Sphingobacteriales bacterium 50-39]|nr:TerB family tellurite resistance protein [Sphingobacteriales bacterium]OJW59363.1 MAG: hypothetical protein BGO55_08810 [Sphingobacteriales bacterium 50-39]